MQYTYMIYKDNWNDRSIQIFSTRTIDSMRPNQDHDEPYFEEFDKFVKFYGHHDVGSQYRSFEALADFFGKAAMLSQHVGILKMY